MALGKHSRTSKGTFRRERGDAKIANLKNEYPQLEQFNGNMHLSTLRDKYNVDSLSQLLKKL
jgi:hypothetical protein